MSSGKPILDFNIYYKEELAQSKLSKKDREKYENEILNWKQRIKKAGYEKQKITRAMNSKKLDRIKAYNLYKSYSKEQKSAQDSITYLKNKLAKKDKEATIRVNGYFENYEINKEQLMKSKNPAVHLLMKEKKVAEKYMKSNFYTLNNERVRNGIEAKYKQIVDNIIWLQGGKETDYPVLYLATPNTVNLL